MIRVFDDTTQAKSRGKLDYKRLLAVHNRPPVISLPTLTTLRISVNDCVLFNAPRLLELSLLMTPSQLPWDRRCMAATVAHIRSHLPNIDSLTILADQRGEQFEEFVLAICRACKGVQRLIVSPSIISVSLLRSVSILPYLKSIQVLEDDLPYSRLPAKPSRPVVCETSLLLRRTAFPSLSSIDLTASSALLSIRLLKSRNFPTRSLTSLWLRFATGAQMAPNDVKAIIKTVVGNCRALQSLTLRFSPFDQFGLDGVTGVTGLQLKDIESFMSLPNLNAFVIDHILPLTLSMPEVNEIARRTASYRVLWLNPYPAITFMLKDWKGLPLAALACFAEHCNNVEHLGLFLNATERTQSTPGLPRLRMLQQLFVGWSQIPHTNLSIGSDDMLCCESTARYLSYILPDFATISTPSDFLHLQSSHTPSRYTRSPHVHFEEQEKDTESIRRAWTVVSAMAKFLRATRLTENELHEPTHGEKTAV